MKKTMLILAGVLFIGAAHANNPQSELFGRTTVEDVYAFELSPFCKAIVQGDVAMVKKLIELGEDVNQKSLGMAPIHFAARYNKAEVLEVLIANGANLKKRCDKGFSAMKYAELSGAQDAMAILKNAMKK